MGVPPSIFSRDADDGRADHQGKGDRVRHECS
jgi:hypothetical protein